MTGTNSAPQNAALPTSSQAAKILMVIACAILFGLTGCAGSVGNQPPELNAALDGARARQANYKANRDAMDAVEDAALADAQSKAIAQDTQVSVANAQAIAAAKGLPTPELINEIARIYAVSSTENLRVSQNLANLRALRQTFDSDYNSANALIQIVEQANASQPVSATAVLTTSINALSPTIQSLQQSAGVATVPTPTATAVQPVVAAPATIRTTVPSTVALPVPSNVPQPTFSK